MDSVRIWMTGAGLVTSLGAGAEATWGRLVSGERGIGVVDLFDTTGFRARNAAQVRGLAMPSSGAWSRTSGLAARAAKEAIDAAKLEVGGRRVGLVVGGTTGGMFENERLLAELHGKPRREGSLVDILSHPLTSTGDLLHETLGPFVRVRTLCSACSSGANAFLVAAAWLLAGDVDAVVAGGTDGLCRLTFSGFNALQAIDPEPCRPFNRRRRGLNLGEGAGFAVFERASVAASRGARPVAEFAGWALSAEAHHITNPEPSGAIAARTIGRALARATLSPREVDYVNAHGTGTPLNDPMESAALARALGDDVRRVAVSSSKGQIGHTLGAAGAVEGIFAAFSVREQMLPPTAGLDDPDPACPLVHVPHVGRRARVRAALSNSFGFGGMDSVLLFTEPELGPGHSAAQRRVVVTGAAALTASGLDDGVTATELLLPPERAMGGGPLALEDGARLDPARARRFDRAARLGTIACERALREAAATGRPLDPARTGAILGSAFGSVDPSAAFIHRVFEKGPRMASPAEFPNLVPSSPVGHVSIYLAIHGPALATADLATSGESAILQGAELVALGEAEAIVAGGVEEASAIVETVFAELFARVPKAPRTPRGEGAAAVVLEAEESARNRGAKVLARVAQMVSWREGQAEVALRALVPPVDVVSARVVLPRANQGIDDLLASSSWSAAERSTCVGRAGEHEALGAVAVAAAVALVVKGEAREVLAVGLAKGRGYAMVLARPGSTEP